MEIAGGFVVTATDRYRAVFSWPEITNTAVGDGVLLLFERDGKPLDEREGRIALVSTADLKARPAPRAQRRARGSAGG